MALLKPAMRRLINKICPLMISRSLTLSRTTQSVMIKFLVLRWSKQLISQRWVARPEGSAPAVVLSRSIKIRNRSFSRDADTVCGVLLEERSPGARVRNLRNGLFSARRWVLISCRMNSARDLSLRSLLLADVVTLLSSIDLIIKFIVSSIQIISECAPKKCYFLELLIVSQIHVD